MRKITILLGISLCLAVITANLAWGSAPVSGPSKTPSLENWVNLDKVLTETADSLEKKTATLTAQVAQEQSALQDLEQETNDLSAAVSTYKAALVVGKMSLPGVVDLLRDFSSRSTRATEKINKLAPELDRRKGKQSEAGKTLSDLQSQVQRLKDKGLPADARALFLAHFERYQRVSTVISGLESQQTNLLQEQLKQWQRQKELFLDLTTSLQKNLEKRSYEQLFQRQSASALRVSLPRLLGEISTVPTIFFSKFIKLSEPGVLSSFLKIHLATLLGVLILWVFLLYGARRLKHWLGPLLGPLSDQAESFSNKIFLALVGTIVRQAYLITAALVATLGLWVLDLSDESGAHILVTALGYYTVFRLCRNLIRSFFKPADPSRGLIPLEKKTAWFYDWSLTLFLAYIFTSLWVFDSLELLRYQTDILVLLEFILSVGLLLWFAWLLQQRYLENLLAGLAFAPESWGARILRGLRLLVWVMLGAIIVSDLLGFQILSLYLAEATCNTLLVAVVFWFLAHLGEDFCAHFTHPTEGLLAKKFDVAATKLETLHSFLPRSFNFIIFLMVLLLIPLFWNVPWSFYQTLFRVISQGPNLGPVRISPLAIILAVISIYGARLFSQLIRFYLEKRVFTRTVWNVAAQQTISTAVNYSLMALGIILALGFLGVNLTNLALIAGALGVGIGFGLQNVVNNFVSGLIILFERPIKVGDLLEIDGKWGEVRAIRVRSTVFETQDHCILIIPNSDLLSSKIQNWTHSGVRPFRLTLKVGVAYGSEVEKVLAVISQVCRDNSRVLLSLEPQIIFQAFGDSALEFVIRVHLRSPDDRDPATHELNRAIYQALQAAGIEIPFPQRDLHLKTPPGSSGAANPALPEQ